MSEQFSINNFMANRWAEAKEILSQQDSAFVKTIGVYDALRGEMGLTLPDNPPTPSFRLEPRWYDLLESTMDISQHLRRLELTVSKVDSAANRRDAIYYFNTWVQDIWSLCEKICRLISVSCSLYSLGKRKEKYRQEVKVKVQDKAGQMRHALVHGADEQGKGFGINARAITEDRLWELGVALGPDNIPQADSFNQEAPSWLRQNKAVTLDILATLGSILFGLDQDIAALTNSA